MSPDATPSQDLTCFAIRSGPEPPWIERATLANVRDALDLDLLALGGGIRPGFEAVEGALFLVCTHGRRDVCCAERGRPLARALAGAFPGRAYPTIFYFDLAPGVDAARAATQLESAFLANGMEAESVEQVMRDVTAAGVTFNRLIQGFMGLGLLVGVAALGVISARATFRRTRQPPEKSATGVSCVAVGKPRPCISFAARASAS